MYTIEDILSRITVLLNKNVIPLLMVTATAVFMWGIVRYITAGGNEERIAEARKYIVYGIISLAVIVAVWGLVALLFHFVFQKGLDPAPTIPTEIVQPI
jgi:fumarate reductase subunit D